MTVSPGDAVTFLNSQGDHTVHSVDDLWPEGVEPVGIAHAREAIVPFPEEGFYGFRCRRHGRYGMVMLVVAGNPVVTDDIRERVAAMRARRREREGLSGLLERYALT